MPNGRQNLDKLLATQITTPLALLVTKLITKFCNTIANNNVSFMHQMQCARFGRIVFLAEDAQGLDQKLVLRHHVHNVLIAFCRLGIILIDQNLLEEGIFLQQCLVSLASLLANVL